LRREPQLQLRTDILPASTPGQIIAASIGVGISSQDTYGVIMEFEGFCTKEEAEQGCADGRGRFSDAQSLFEGGARPGD